MIATPRKIMALSLAFFFFLIIVGALSMSVGAAKIGSVKTILGIGADLMGYKSSFSPGEGTILYKIRLPRVLLAALVGLTLGVAGVVFQTLLRNPLAEPFILGISGGAAFGAILAMGFGLASLLFGVQLCAFLGATFTIFLVFGIAGIRGRLQTNTILLAGVIVNAFFTAVIMFVISTTMDNRIHGILFWLYGDLSLVRYSQILKVLPFVILGTSLIYIHARDLNLIVAGEETALQLGVNVELTKKMLLIMASLITGVIVSVSGIIGFVGLIVPHLMRMLFGSDHRLLIPISAIFGASFLVMADTIARTIISPSELPVGVVTAFVGVPFFIILLKKRGARWAQS